MSPKTDELIDQVRRSLRDEADAIVVADEPFDPTRSGLALDPAIDAEPSRTGRRLAVVGIAAVACLIVGIVALAVRHDDGSKVDSTGPPTNPAPWFLPTGTEKPMPTFPPGWQVLDYGAVRFAVPAGWRVLAPGWCPPIDEGVVGYVLVHSPGDPTPYCPAMKVSLPMVSVTADAADPNIPPVYPRTIGTFSAAGEFSDIGVMGTSDFRLDNGYAVSVSGPDTMTILDTFTDSGRVRALQAGPTVDRSDWKAVSYAGVSFQVPPGWDTTDLSAGITRTTTAGGIVNSEGGQPDPGWCDGPWFTTQEPATVFTGTSGMLPSCPPSPSVSLGPADGVWIRGQGELITTMPKTPDTGPPTQDLRVVMSTVPTQPALVLDAQYRGTDAEVIVGVGLDPAVARTILQSLHVD